MQMAQALVWYEKLIWYNFFDKSLKLPCLAVMQFWFEKMQQQCHVTSRVCPAENKK